MSAASIVMIAIGVITSYSIHYTKLYEPADYPMVAPNYARHRSSLAKKIGLGTRARRGAE